MYHLLKGEGCETSVEHALPLWAGSDEGYCLRRPSPSPTWGSRFVGARELRPSVAEPKLQGETTLRGSPRPTYLPVAMRILSWIRIKLKKVLSFKVKT